MSIVTKRGDRGTTALMYNRQVSKCHPRVEAYGAVDELNAALGLARAAAEHDPLRENLTAIQKDLVLLMGELATAAEDLPRYVKDGHSLVTPGHDGHAGKVDRGTGGGEGLRQRLGHAGRERGPAALDFARTVCRRAERRACALQEAGQLHNPEIVVYLNRLSDLLWLLARWVEGSPSRGLRPV